MLTRFNLRARRTHILIHLAAVATSIPLMMGQGCPPPSTGGGGGGGGGGLVGPPGPRTITDLTATGAAVGGQGLVRITLDNLVAADTAVTLSSSDQGVLTVPASATIPEGADSVDVAFTGVGPGVANIAAQLDSSTRTTTATVVSEIRVNSLFGSPRIQTGAVAQLTINLNIAAPTNVTVNLTSSDHTVLSVPATVTVSSFSTQQALAAPAGKAGRATITAALGSSSLSIDVEVVSTVALDRVSAPSTTLVGGLVQVFVNLDAVTAADAKVALTSSDPAVIAVPARLTVLANSNSAHVTLTALAAGRTTLTASFGGKTQTAQVNVVTEPTITNVNVFPFSVPKGSSASVQISLNVQTVSDTLVNLTSSNPSAVTVPASLIVPAGQNSGLALATGVGTGPAIITATVGNSSAATNALGVEPSTTTPTLAGVFGPSTLTVGTAGEITVSLTGPATADTPVALASGNTAVLTVPGTAVIPLGATTVNVPVKGIAAGTAGVTVNAAGSTFVFKVQVVDATLAISNFFADNPSVAFSSTMSINLSEIVTADTTITLANNQPTIVSVPTSAVVLSGQSFVTVPITGLAASPPNATITATLGASTKTVTVTVSPP